MGSFGVYQHHLSHKRDNSVVKDEVGGGMGARVGGWESGWETFLLVGDKSPITTLLLQLIELDTQPIRWFISDLRKRRFVTNKK